MECQGISTVHSLTGWKIIFRVAVLEMTKRETICYANPYESWKENITK